MKNGRLHVLIRRRASLLLFLFTLMLALVSCSETEVPELRQTCDVESDTTEYIHLKLDGSESCIFKDVGFFITYYISSGASPASRLIIGSDTMDNTYPERYRMQITRYDDPSVEYWDLSSFEADIRLLDGDKSDTMYFYGLPFIDTIQAQRNNMYAGKVTVVPGDAPSQDQYIGTIAGWLRYVSSSEVVGGSVVNEYDTIPVEGSYRLDPELN